MKKVTIKDIAKVANVSYTTVSRALSGSPEIGENTRKQILQIAKEMGYTANAIARSLVAKETRLIGLIVSSINNPFMSEIAYHVEEYARSKGYNIMLGNSVGDLDQEEETYQLLAGRQVDGIIIIPSSMHTYERISPYLKTTPTVFVSENLRDVEESYVTIDNYKGTYMGTEYLHSLGHRSILYFARRQGSVTHQLRYQGYMDACKAFRIKPQFIDSHYNSSSINHGYTLACELFRRKRNYTAMFCSTDTIALGVLQAAEEFKIRIPEDLSLLGFDNISFSALPKINLTTIEQPKDAMAAVAVDMLIEKVRTPSMGYSHKIMIPSLIIRSSCLDISEAAAATGQ